MADIRASIVEWHGGTPDERAITVIEADSPSFNGHFWRRPGRAAMSTDPRASYTVWEGWKLRRFVGGQCT
jgi:hypothetical protein